MPTKGARYRVRLSQTLNAKLLELCARWDLEPESVFRRLLEGWGEEAQPPQPRPSPK